MQNKNSFFIQHPGGLKPRKSVSVILGGSLKRVLVGFVRMGAR